MYIELFMLDNVLMNALILLTASALITRPLKWLPCLIFSTIGAVYSALAVSLVPILLSLPFKCLLAVLMTLPLCWKWSFKKAFIAFLGSTFLVGGVVWALTIAFGGDMSYGVLTASSVPLRTTLIGAVATAFLPRTIRMWFREKALSSGECKARFTIGGQSCELSAFIDTGNTLYEPLSGLPVIVVSSDSIVIPKKLPVPYSTASGDDIMYACRPDSLQICINNVWQNVDALIAKAPNALHGVGALIPCQLTLLNN